MLLWCLDEQKHGILPRSVDLRRKIAIGLEAFCHVEEVVGFSHSIQRAVRAQSLQSASAQLVRSRIKDRKVYTPLSREDRLLEEQSRYSSVPREWHKELADLEARFASGKLSYYIGYPPGEQIPGVEKIGRKPVRTSPVERTPEYKRLHYLQQIVTNQKRQLRKVDSLVEEQATIDALDLQRCDASLEPTRVQEIVSYI